MQQRKLLILDIDETLIHGAEQRLDREPDAVAPWCFLYKRPHVDSFMQFCREHFRVAVWTTATPEHAEFCLSKICEPDYPFAFIWTRERCTQVRDMVGMYDMGVGYHWVKTLAKIKRHGFALEQTMMVDDTPSVLERNYGNLVKIDRYLGDPDDMELLRLMPYLLDLKEVENIRSIEKRGWKSHYDIQPSSQLPCRISRDKGTGKAVKE